VQLLHVLLPGRPNGSRGWIARAGTTLTKTSWRILVRTASRRVLVFHHGRLARTLIAIVGKPSTPTPHGLFFVEESVRMPPGSTGGPYALALSAHSNVLQEFEGGSGQVAIHGLANTAASASTTRASAGWPHTSLLASPCASHARRRLPDHARGAAAVRR
jgi:hypothetical protein